MPMSFEDYLKENAQKIENELDQILSQFLMETKKISPNILPSALAFIESCKGGKRIRGVLCKLGYEIGSSKLNQEIIKVAAALEIMHTAILIHDDIVDKSPKRRGKQSLYKKVGIDQAMALGDLGFFLAIKIISESNFSEERKNKALKLFSKTMFDTAIGQVMDIQKRKKDEIIIAKLKTTWYTISGPLKLGAVLAEGSLSLLQKLGEFGDNLGIVFQIRDDILDRDDSKGVRSRALKYISESKK